MNKRFGLFYTCLLVLILIALVLSLLCLVLSIRLSQPVRAGLSLFALASSIAGLIVTSLRLRIR